jgi:CRP-like cAMP-binding protein
MVCSFAMSYTTQDGDHNRLLASLPREDAASPASTSRFERPPQGRTLTARSAPDSDVWFPHTGVVAVVATDASGRSVQAGLEGGVGLEALCDVSAELPDSVAQIGGCMSVMPAAALRSATFERPAIRAALPQFLCGLSAQSLQTIACNRLHSLPSRCCRWLLTLQDRASCDELPLTQESLATLLRGGRSRINALLALLEKNGLVRPPSRSDSVADAFWPQGAFVRVLRRISSHLSIALRQRTPRPHCLDSNRHLICNAVTPFNTGTDVSYRSRLGGASRG